MMPMINMMTVGGCQRSGPMMPLVNMMTVEAVTECAIICIIHHFCW